MSFGALEEGRGDREEPEGPGIGDEVHVESQGILG
jgi:hypothetical protein